MATIKSYTSLQQSRKLAEFLSLESADMYYLNGDAGKISIGEWENNVHDEDDIPCWSLAALLDVLPNENMLVKTTDGEYYCLAKDVMTMHYDNAIDACVAMIEKLNELNLL